MHRQEAFQNTSGTLTIYRVGGFSALLLGSAYIAITVLYSVAGARPTGSDATLAYLATRTTLWWAITFLSVFTDLLFPIVALSLFIALKEAGRITAIIGSGLLGLFAYLDLAITWPNYVSLITLSGGYAAAGASQQATLLAAASSPIGVLSSPFFSLYAILVPALGIMILSARMKANFGKGAFYTGLITGVLGIVSVAGPVISSSLGSFAILASVFTVVWVLLVGYQLLRLG